MCIRDSTYTVTVLFAEKSDGAQFLGFFDRYVAVLFQRNVGTYLGIHEMCIRDSLYADYLVAASGHKLDADAACAGK